jgi:membrane protein
LKSGRPTGFLDASEALRVYHCAGIVNPDGRLQASPWRLGGLSPAVLVRRVYVRLDEHDVFDRAASLSYYFLFALFPTMLFLTALLGLLPVPELMDRLLEYITRMLPGDAASLLIKTLAEVVKGARGSLVSIGVLAALWGAASGMVSIRTALNVAYGARDRRPWWRQRLDAVALTVWFSLLTLLALLLLVFGERIGEAVAGALGVGQAFTRTWNFARWPLGTMLALFGITLVYHFAPATPQRWRWVTPGSAFALMGWLVASYGLRLYVGYFGNYNATYGSIGGVILLMLWLYLSSLALLVGAEINSLIRLAEQDRGV